jgi:hypothetical protein
MQFTTISASLVALLTSAVYAAPTVQVESAEIEARDDDTNSCQYSYKFLYNAYSVGIANGIGDCQGLRDNLNGQCGEAGILGWNCGVSSIKTMTATFTAPETCSEQQVGNAIWISTTPHTTGVTCHNNGQ